MSFNPGTELASLDFENLIGGPLNAITEAQNNSALTTVDFIKSTGFDDAGDPIYVEFRYPKEIAPYQPGTEGQIVGVTITTPGSGYANGDIVTFASTEPGSVNATGVISVNATGAVQSVEITNPGSGFPSNPVSGTISSQGSSAAGAAIMGTVGSVPSTPALYQNMKIQVPIITMLPLPFIEIAEARINFNAKINSVETSRASSNIGISGSAELKLPRFKFKVSGSFRKSTYHGTNVDKTYSMNIDILARNAETPEGLSRLLGILEQVIVATPE